VAFNVAQRQQLRRKSGSHIRIFTFTVDDADQVSLSCQKLQILVYIDL
jgi:hypothetical protein